MMEQTLPKPAWIRVRAPGGETWKHVNEVLSRRNLHTVCDEARCPNKGECWGMGTATFMILGDCCTRSCRFCAVVTAKTGRPVREDEGAEIALAAEELNLPYVVLTSVDRDDLSDRGAGHFARCVRAVKEKNPRCKVEALIPDYFGDELIPLIKAAPDVIAHNVETVRSLQVKIRDQRASFDKSLRTLREAAAGLAALPGQTGNPVSTKVGSPVSTKVGNLTKSSLLLGLGETEAEIFSAMDELREAGVNILVLGQYLRPSKNQIPVVEYLSPETFAKLGEAALERGFASVVSSPLARTSYHARNGHADAEKHARTKELYAD
ncbi:lipoyl synthase [Spirochaetia bacterium]|nr:lipoyl synthase [Spirochaetia bacterium]